MSAAEANPWRLLAKLVEATELLVSAIPDEAHTWMLGMDEHGGEYTLTGDEARDLIAQELAAEARGLIRDRFLRANGFDVDDESVAS